MRAKKGDTVTIKPSTIDVPPSWRGLAVKVGKVYPHGYGVRVGKLGGLAYMRDDEVEIEVRP